MPFCGNLSAATRPACCRAAGVATAMVGNKDKYGQYEEHPGMIHIIKKGTTSLALVETEEPTTIPWGIGSAAQVCGGDW